MSIPEAATSVPTTPPAPEAPRPDFAGRERGVSLAVVGFVILTVITMWPALSNLSDTVMGSIQPADATAGGVWGGWQLLTRPPFSASTPYLGAPQGSQFWDASYVTKLGWILPQWLLVHFVGPIGSWNGDLALGFIADGMAMFLLVRWVVGKEWIAFVAGVLYAFSPFHVEESYAHIGYVFTWIFPLIVWAGLAVIQRPTARRGMLLGAATGLAAYTDPYYLLFAPLLAVFLATAGLLWAPAANVKRVELLKGFAAAAITTWIAVVPIAFTFLVGSGSVHELLTTRSLLNPNLFQRAHLWEYFVPWSASPVWGWLTTGWVKARLGTLQPTETSLYLGSGVLLLSIGFWMASPWTSPWIREQTGDEFQLSPRFLAVTSAAVAAAIMLCSFARIGPISGLPELVWHFEPLWRAFTRLQLVLDVLVILAACVGLALIARSRVSWLAPVLALLAIVDGTAIFPWSSWSYAAHTPVAIAWLAKHPDGGIVAAYPMQTRGYPSLAAELTFQEVHRHRLFNGAAQNTSRGQLERGVDDIDDPQTVPTLRREGVRYVLMDLNYYIAMKLWEVHLHGLHLLVSEGGVRLYRILPGQPAPAAITVIQGFNLERPFLPHVERYMLGSTAMLGIQRLESGVPFRIEFHARSYKKPRHLWVYQDDVLRWRGVVGIGIKTVVFSTKSIGPLRLVCSPGSVHVHGFGNRRSVLITNFGVQRAA